MLSPKLVLTFIIFLRNIVNPASPSTIFTSNLLPSSTHKFHHYPWIAVYHSQLESLANLLTPIIFNFTFCHLTFLPQLCQVSFSSMNSPHFSCCLATRLLLLKHSLLAFLLTQPMPPDILFSLQPGLVTASSGVLL